MTLAESVVPKPPTALPTPAPEPVIQRGVCFLLFAYDIGLAIDLDDTQRRIATASERTGIRHKRRAPRYFDYRPAPVRVTHAIEAVRFGPFETAPTVEAVIYDFGAISLQFSVPLAGPLSGLLPLAEAVYDNPALLEQSRRLAERLLDIVRPAVSRPAISELIEDYAIYQIESFAPEVSLEHLVTEFGPLLARVLRAENLPLSSDEVKDTLACQLAFTPRDRAVIDWNAAVLFDEDAEDVRAVLEFANVELLELRYLDDRLDEALDQAYLAVSRRRGYRMPGARADALWRIAQLQMDSAMLYEGVNNALKLLGDQFLARLYRLASQRLHLNDWDASILRKLNTLESLYSKIADRRADRRIELLEWIIIILIALEIVLTFVPGIRPV